MKRSMLILAAAACVSVSGLFAKADLIYSQNFDAVGQAALVSPGLGTGINTVSLSAVLPGWTVKVNNAIQTNVTIANGTVGGFGVGAYLATGNGTDFNLSTYETANASVDSISYSFKNTGTKALSGLIGSFDFESAWSRYTLSSPRSAGFENGLSYSINGGTAVSLSGTATHVTNATLGTATTWLTDAQMNSAGLAARNIGFSLNGVTLNAGDSLTFMWSRSIYYSSNKNLAQGIDNFKLGDNNSLASALSHPTIRITR